MTNRLPDADARAAALDPAGSFIVQAPAGSGKTGLLIQRMLTLLAGVEAPEEVIAITFTRKAAGEMLRRLVDALADARGEGGDPKDAHAAHTRALAEAVLARDGSRGWDLTDNPARLKVYTFDAFCQHLARRMPFLTGLGGDLRVAEPADELYAEAARRVLDRLDEPGPEGVAVARLLAHQDNDRARAEGLLAAMLERRDQWLRHVAGRDPAAFARDVEEAVGRMVAEELEGLARHMAGHLDDAVACARHSAANLADDHDVHALAAGPPTADPADLPAWRGLAALLLTGTGEVRKAGGVNARLGFPPGGGDNAAMKGRMGDLLDALAGDPDTADALARARELPDPARTEEWHALLAAVGTCLLGAVGDLMVVFTERRRVDYTQVALGAHHALGPEDRPTDLGLVLDHRIRHLLVDEFQDTSHRQFHLVHRLTAGWTPGDGRTLFLVGDPMQSIYGFRDADVGLYLKAWEEGIGHLPLTPLRLSANFRSAPGVVEWVNGAFSRIFPRERDLARGAVPYAPGHAARAEPGEVTFDPVAGRDDATEAERVVARVRAARAADPQGTIAVLVRGRPHLQAILPGLRSEFRVGAVEIAPLARTPVIVDLMTLCRALIHPADRVAWLALLRAPWCGLTLADLHTVAADAPERTVGSLIAEPERVARLPSDARSRLSRVRDALDAAGAPLEVPLADRVETAWVNLGGPAALESAADLGHAERFLALLADLEAEGGTFSLARLEARVAKLYADTDGDPEVHVMTIHRAKGLEWDTVVLPGLGRGGGQDEAPLLMWLERQRAGAEAASDLLLAPAPERGGDKDPLYALIRRIARDRRRAEEARLLYVAATRARRRLHLVGHAERNKRGGYVPRPGSLLGYLRDVVADDLNALAAPAPAVAPETPVWGTPLPLRRLPEGWAPPEPAPAVTGEVVPVPLPETSPEFSWAGEVARAAGTVAHRAIEWLAREGAEGWDADRVRREGPRVRAALSAMGMADDDAATAAARVGAALVTMLEDTRGRWLLEPRPEGRAELAVAGHVAGRVVHRTMDRTFVEKGVRWIVDYKTGRHEGADLEHFLDEEQRRYRPQLEEYARLMAQLDGDGRPIRLGLYFPAHGAWREWPYEAGEEAVVPA